MTGKSEYFINFSEQWQKFCSSFCYNEVNCYLFVNGAGIYKSLVKDPEQDAAPLYLCNILNNVLADDMKKAGLFGYNLDYNTIDVADILNIYQYLTLKIHVK